MLSHSEAYWTALYARAFVERGDDILVLSFSRRPLEGIPMEHVGIEPWRQHKYAYITRVPRIRAILLRFKPEVVVASYLVSNGLAAALSWPGPLVVSAHGGDVLQQAHCGPLRRRVKWAVVRFVCRRSTLVHTVSHEMDEILRGLGVPASKIVRIPLGVDTSVFTPAGDMPRAQATRLICTRKHEPVYDIPTILDALARLKRAGRRFHCTLVGGGPLQAEHEARASALGLESCITFTGQLAPERMPEVLRGADVYVSASLSDGTSSALLEAMSVGLLPVVTRIPANEPWLEHGRTGLFFEPRRGDELAEMLQRAMDDDALRRRAFEENRRRVEAEGDITRNMSRYLSAVDECVRQSLSGGRV